MTEQLKDIGRRLSDLRSIMGLDAEAFSAMMEVTPEDLLAYEAGEKDFSFSFLHNAAGILDVDVIDLLSGESPRLSSCCLVRKGEGLSIDRRSAYNYKHLAFTFRHKLAEPFLVTVQPSDEIPTLHAHEGQELNYMESGRMTFYLGEMTYELAQGDSVYFDASIPHAMRAMEGAPAVFLAVVMNSASK